MLASNGKLRIVVFTQILNLRTGVESPERKTGNI